MDSACKTDLASVLRYLTPLGSHPRERPINMFIKRREPFTGALRVVPEIAYSTDHRQQPVPIHELLEDDWRAYRTYAYVTARMARLEKLLASHVYQVQDPQEPPQSTQDARPCRPLCGCHSCGPHRVPRTLPMTVFTGPFQKVMPVARSCKLKRKVGWQYRKQMSRPSAAFEEDATAGAFRGHHSSADPAVPFTLKELSELPWQDMDKMEPYRLRHILSRVRGSIV